MKAIVKIGVLIITFMVVASIFLFINIETYGIDGGMRFGGFQLLLIIGIPWFISYSKWANDNIWNKKSYTSNTEVIESKDDNEEVLETIDNVLNNPENDDEETSLKIEELKKQIESLEESLNKKDSNSQDKGYKKVKNKL